MIIRAAETQGKNNNQCMLIFATSVRARFNNCRAKAKGVEKTQLLKTLCGLLHGAKDSSLQLLFLLSYV